MDTLRAGLLPTHLTSPSFLAWVEGKHGADAAHVIPRPFDLFPAEHYWCSLPESEEERQERTWFIDACACLPLILFPIVWPRLYEVIWARFSSEMKEDDPETVQQYAWSYGYPPSVSPATYGPWILRIAQAQEYVRTGTITRNEDGPAALEHHAVDDPAAEDL